MMILYLNHDCLNKGSQNREAHKKRRIALFSASLCDYAKRNHIPLPANTVPPLNMNTGVHGKPRFADIALGRIHFSISHSGRFWAVLFHDREVGIDIEDMGIRHPSPDRIRALAQRYYAPDEIDYIINGDACAVDMDYMINRDAFADGVNCTINGDAFAENMDMTQRFFDIWTRKEAFLKYTGEGITRPLNAFSVAGGMPKADATGRIIRRRFSEFPDLACAYCTMEGASIKKVFALRV